jgi:hypothetical protein
MPGRKLRLNNPISDINIANEVPSNHVQSYPNVVDFKSFTAV